MYKVFLDEIEIATTKLEGGDPPMGVSSGVLNFKDKNFGYKEIKEFCEKNNIDSFYPFTVLLCKGATAFALPNR